MNRIRVLVADDDYLNRKVLQIKLEHRGIACDVAESGTGAIRLFGKHCYDVVVLDQFMPGLTGSEVALAIRGKAPRTVLIGLTGDPAQLPNMEAAGFDRIFVKPLRDRACIEYIERSRQAVV